MNMEIELLQFFYELEIFKPFEIEMFILHKKYVARGYKGDQPFFGISKVF